MQKYNIADYWVQIQEFWYHITEKSTYYLHSFINKYETFKVYIL